MFHRWRHCVSPAEDIYQGDYCQWETFNASCAANEAILMDNAQYGRLRVSRCVRRGYGVVGCAANVLPLADSKCSGRRQCSLVVAEISLQGVRPCPEEFTSYLEIGYRCVPGYILFMLIYGKEVIENTFSKMYEGCLLIGIDKSCIIYWQLF